MNNNFLGSKSNILLLVLCIIVVSIGVWALAKDRQMYVLRAPQSQPGTGYPTEIKHVPGSPLPSSPTVPTTHIPIKVMTGCSIVNGHQVCF